MATETKKGKKTVQTTISLTKLKGEVLLNALQQYKTSLVTGYQSAAVGEEELVKWAKYLSVIDRVIEGVKKGMERIEKGKADTKSVTDTDTGSSVEDAM